MNINANCRKEKNNEQRGLEWPIQKRLITFNKSFLNGLYNVTT